MVGIWGKKIHDYSSSFQRVYGIVGEQIMEIEKRKVLDIQRKP